MLYTYGMKILLTEGSGLTSRQVATRLDQLGHDVSVAVADPLCMARFTGHVHHLLPVRQFGDDPLGWFDDLLARAASSEIDVVFPTQEQVTVLSHQLPRLEAAGLATAVPPFASLRRVHDKLSASATMDHLGIAQPPSWVVQQASDAADWVGFPAFVKAPVGTGSTGVRRVEDAEELAAAVAHFVATGAGFDGGVLVQQAVEGTLVMAQCVFQAGSLVAFHANERVAEGANGSASAKRSLSVPTLRADLARLGEALAWHGALSVDAIVADGQAFVIDVNPRLVEPGNAWAAGTDLVGALLAVALGRHVEPASPSRPGVRTHQFLMAILGAAQRQGRRRDVFGELLWRLLRRGAYANSQEELQPVRGDWRALILPLVAALATLVRPSMSSAFTEGAVSRYALSPDGWRRLCAIEPCEVASAPSPG
jgi:predicted ATP-grasp superfamily ATP-dependent carboligase